MVAYQTNLNINTHLLVHHKKMDNVRSFQKERGNANLSLISPDEEKALVNSITCSKMFYSKSSKNIHQKYRRQSSIVNEMIKINNKNITQGYLQVSLTRPIKTYDYSEISSNGIRIYNLGETFTNQSRNHPGTP